MTIRGDFGKLERAIRNVEQLTRFASRATRRMGQVAHALAVSGSESAVNPQGRAWKPLKNGGGKALRKVAGSLGLTGGDLWFKIASRLPWAIFHQKGSKARAVQGPALPGKKRQTGKWRLPVRRILPKKSLPKRWRERLEAVVKQQWSGLWR